MDVEQNEIEKERFKKIDVYCDLLRDRKILRWMDEGLIGIEN